MHWGGDENEQEEEDTVERWDILPWLQKYSGV